MTKLSNWATVISLLIGWFLTIYVFNHIHAWLGILCGIGSLFITIKTITYFINKSNQNEK